VTVRRQGQTPVFCWCFAERRRNAIHELWADDGRITADYQFIEA